ncbi:MAG: NAD(P)/FAD-dependent oxidoreductase [Rubellimicrobium sp.]|nr:NAD(P)/FAD-dependent oxidoreductase [Rubellimicrobium sp.]
MPRDAFDVVLLGGGHNGLSAAITLARKGRSVCVLERGDRTGGMARSTQIALGVEAPEVAHLLYNLGPRVARELGVADLLETPPLPTVSLAPDGRHVVIEGDAARFADGTAHPDARAFTELSARLRRFAGILARLSLKPPPELDGGLTDMATLGELAGLARLGIDLKRLGRRELREFLRIVLGNAADLVLDEMPDGPLAGALCADAVRGNHVGPRSPGTVFNLMYRLGNGGAPRLPRGGMGALGEALERAARAAGADIRTGCEVARIMVADDRVTGVELRGGAVIAARAVLSSAGPLQTMVMAGVGHFDIEPLRRLRNLRCKGTVAKVNLLLRGAPAVTGLPDDMAPARLLVAPSVQAVERAFNPVKYDELPVAPVLEAVLHPPAGDGRCVLSVNVQHIPHTPAGGWDDAARDGLTGRTVAQLAAHMPGLAALVETAQLLTPADIEDRFGAPGGHWHHGEMGIDQILTLRPANGLAGYRLGVRGLYLCGAATHPGGDVTGLPGRNAARQLLGDGII